MIASFGKSFAFAFVRSAAGVAAVAVAPIALHAIKRAPVAYHKVRVRVVNRLAKTGQRMGCDAEAKLSRKGH
jgi:hypothetical protein